MQTWPDNNESIFVFRSSVNSIGTEGTVYKNRTFYNSIIKSVNKKGSATAFHNRCQT